VPVDKLSPEAYSEATSQYVTHATVSGLAFAAELPYRLGDAPLFVSRSNSWGLARSCYARVWDQRRTLKHTEFVASKDMQAQAGASIPKNCIPSSAAWSSAVLVVHTLLLSWKGKSVLAAYQSAVGIEQRSFNVNPASLF
jgi:hypothetical protein